MTDEQQISIYSHTTTFLVETDLTSMLRTVFFAKFSYTCKTDTEIETTTSNPMPHMPTPLFTIH